MESSTSANLPPSSPGGFFESLMDTRFDQLITPKLIRFLYIVSMIVLALGVLAVVISGFASSAGSGVLALILAPIGALIYLIVIRLWLELIIVTFKIRDAADSIADNTRRPVA
ncbi:MAG: DUF4282 domain-containing protein [Thermoleophilia bacterium]|nr:DUF4282 domain-containing protein [Thermoleophilia bacterium]